MARGDTGSDERSTGLLLGAILGLLALAAVVVVVWVSYEPDRPTPTTPTTLLFETTVAGNWRLCDDTSALTDDGLLTDSDRIMRSRGYVPVDDWSGPQAVATTIAAGDSIRGGCGVIVATRVGSSSVHGNRVAGVEHTSCGSARWSVGTCGESVTFVGYGDIRHRAYVMPAVTPVDGMHPELTLAQAEAEHLLSNSGFAGDGRTMLTTLATGDRIELPTPASECTRFVIAGFGAVADLRGARPLNVYEAPFVRAVAVCGSDIPLEITSHVSDVQLAIRPFSRRAGGPGGTHTATISGTETVATVEDMAATASP